MSPRGRRGLPGHYIEVAVAMGRFDEAIVLAREGLQIGVNDPWIAASLIAAVPA